MLYSSSPGSAAISVGKSTLSAASACRLALRDIPGSCAALVGRMEAIFCSASAILARVRTNAGPRSLGRKWQVSKYALTHQRISVISAVSGGQSSTSAIRTRPDSISFTPSPTRPGYHPLSTTVAGQARIEVNAGYKGHGTVRLRCGKALALIAGLLWGFLTPSRDHEPSFSGVLRRQGRAR